MLIRLLLVALLAAPSVLQAQDSLTIHHIDVDQGDATLFVMPNGNTLLVDSGLTSRGDTVAEFLQAHGITQLDAFVATHYDADHYGGIPKVVEAGIEVARWYDRGEKAFVDPDKTDDDGDVFDRYVDAADSPVRLMPDSIIALDSTVTVVVVASNGHVRGAIGKYEIDSLDENGYSVALLVSYRGFNYLLGGNLTREVENRIAREAALGDVDVYHVNHHGAATSSTVAFVKAIRPEVAVVSNGSQSCFNHPRQAVLGTLRQVPEIDIYQTNKLLDLVQCRSGEEVGGNVSDNFIADLDEEGKDGTITIVVKEDEYRVDLVTREISRSYPIEPLPE